MKRRVKQRRERSEFLIAMLTAFVSFSVRVTAVAVSFVERKIMSNTAIYVGFAGGTISGVLWSWQVRRLPMNTMRNGIWLAVVFVLVLLWVISVSPHIPVLL